MFIVLCQLIDRSAWDIVRVRIIVALNCGRKVDGGSLVLTRRQVQIIDYLGTHSAVAAG